ncbi:aminomethyl-transferring glycine dehydrogenase [Aureibacter tunicatorum]|uniref:Glycine dehydrogenase (decarboxylating) n=2 Tax=Aureibacter tunicatorum TaxID=866807 RepID=A0AAE3XIQ0_9BACT|nr:aminomethyl-transferring glycine dehydrogenase [Aureibacter tunicatorum]MDR6237155.1 glycine dehydrogenase [Aureibacter tunicatorum]BDD06147.1 glycine dehydrogenase (aminomethyl-transferring) [Aureibacter tunicatorum]
MTKINLRAVDRFDRRHNNSDQESINAMLKTIGVESVDQLIDETIPSAIRSQQELDLPEALSEFDFIRDFKAIAGKNKVFKSYIGLGYNDTITPNVILRNIFENPGWYTAYTPYQAEIAQGRLEALINFQTVITDLTGMEIANASLLDEGTAAAEAMGVFYSLRKGKKKKTANKFFIDSNVFPQTIDVIKTRALPIGVELIIDDIANVDVTDETLFGILVQYPNNDGAVNSPEALIASAHENDVKVAVAADLLSLTLLKAPGAMNADVVCGSSQRFGVPMGYGGPHAGYFATREDYKRQIPGRIIGVSMDRRGKKGYRMALQTREQHIKREKATSNICTAQVLLAVMAGMYAVYHGPKGLTDIASKINGSAKAVANGIEQLGFKQENEVYFDSIKVAVDSEEQKAAIKAAAEAKSINFRYFETNHVGISIGESVSVEDIEEILSVFAEVSGKSFDLEAAVAELEVSFPEGVARDTEFLTHEVFNKYQMEHEMLRYIKRLENKDLSLVHSMISLGSCTMKLNATAEMIPVTWPEIGKIHPYAPVEQAQGYAEIFTNLEAWLSEITGFAGTSLQPNSGAQGEFAGLMAIRAYHENNGDFNRNVAIIPTSAHGTNPASAALAGMKIVLVSCDEKGNIDVEDLRNKAELHKDNLSCLMVTYPSTHGVYEESIKEITQIIHDNGGQVYMDGANMNAQVGLTSPGNIGADVCHLNLHKTFCIPHGGGGPGVGPIGVAAHLVPFLPGNPLIAEAGGEKAISSISAAPWGSASILPISYAYIAMMGPDGLKEATRTAILNANYIKARLEKVLPILYTNENGRCAHEMIVDFRQFKSAGIEVEDVAKRLIDYGFHAPTVSFPVAGTLMIEPTESESLEELDRFCEALISIRQEIQDVIDGRVDAQDNVLKNAPHTAEEALGDWDHAYTREDAVYPNDAVRSNKFWPSVSRVDNAYGDRNLMCSCIPTEAYADEAEIEA